MKSIKIKAYSFFLLFVVMFGVISFALYHAAMQSEYIQAARQQSTYKLNVTYTRGMIYDCNMNPLVSKTQKKIASIAPSIEVISYLNAELANGNYSAFSNELESGKPFLLKTDRDLDSKGITMFDVPVRYEVDQLASHVIGYMDGNGEGVSGIEMAMNDVLGQNIGELSSYYQVDAMGRVIAGEAPVIVNTVKETKSGVVLTIDENIQRVAEKAAEKLGVGAVIVAEVPNCEVRALVSTPGYSPDAIGEVAMSEDAPLINRAFSPYAPGSVFKLISAAEQIEEEKDGYIYNCTGVIAVDDMNFHCINGVAHGKVNLESAIEKSCNCYFVDAVSKIGGQSILKMAYNTGLGSSVEFGKGLFSSAGNLPSAEELLNQRALANFSFGQGSLTLTPLQIVGLINTIASYGEYTQPKLIAGTVDDHLEYTPSLSIYDEKLRVMKVLTVEKLQRYMEKAVKNGTAKDGDSDQYRSGAKTGTAQTGVYEGENEQNHYWYSGYIKDGTVPRYSIVVFRESTTSDDGVTAKVFKEISEYIAENVF